MKPIIALGLGTKNSSNQWLEVFYPTIILEPEKELLTFLEKKSLLNKENITLDLDTTGYQDFPYELFLQEHRLYKYIRKTDFTRCAVPVIGIVYNNLAPRTVPEIYLKLQMLSHRYCKPHETNLEGLFSLLPNVAWTNRGVFELADVYRVRMQSRSKDEGFYIRSLDKFPPMTDYVVPDGVRIADTARVRLGAYLGQGTTIMHEGFVNFNAGTEGPNMVEGRISAGVFVGKGSDLGGGSSTMGTLSGGNQTVISVGKNCLIGANAGIGISLGDRCTVESGLYVTAASKVELIENSVVTGVVKAIELHGKSDVLFRRNSINGKMQCLVKESTFKLNDALHAHN